MKARVITISALFGLGLGLSGCAQSQDAMDSLQNAVHDFNPFGTAKKPLPGERKALFPEGVPGVQQGVPPELMRGASQADAVPEPEAQPRVAEPKRTRSRRVRTTAAPPPAERPRPPRRTAPSSAPVSDPPPDGVWPPPPPRSAQQRPAAPAPAAAQPAARRTQPPSAWTPPPANQPVPTIWPDPPKAQ